MTKEDMYYQKNAKQYFDLTVHIDPSTFLSPLAKVLAPGSEILDIGCGSGRDLLWFRQNGFNATGFELSPRLASMARNHSNCPVIEGDFLKYDFSCLSVDALVFVGSLVHQSTENVLSILQSTCRALVNGGYILLTMKEGNNTFIYRDGRYFFLWNQNDLEEIFITCKMQIVTFSRQVSKLHHDDTWLEYVLHFPLIRGFNTNKNNF